MNRSQPHSTLLGYLLWIFGFLGAHRFYYGKPISGTFYFLNWVSFSSAGSMDQNTAIRVNEGEIEYNIAWLLLTFLGLLGVHRMYMGKWLTDLVYLCTGGLFLVGYIYDFWMLNDQISLINSVQMRS